MPRVVSNGIELEYDTFGSPAGRPLLLIMGLSAQMILWEEEFCGLLADRGHFVVRFDNRDIGLSSKSDAGGTPNIPLLFAKSQLGMKVSTPYTLSDMALDTIGLLDALGLRSAHICGASMGARIAHLIAIQHRTRIRSLTSIMSGTGNPKLPPPRPKVAAMLARSPVYERSQVIESAVEMQKLVSGGEVDEPALRAMMTRAYDRCHHPAGMVRQLAAMLVEPSRVEELRKLSIPALVVHGKDDPLAPVEGALDTHACIAGSKLLLLERMGHELPRVHWTRIIDAISELTQHADVRAHARSH
jgi:pimeloyl-ACP methyl ester carboxylesterase